MTCAIVLLQEVVLEIAIAMQVYIYLTFYSISDGALPHLQSFANSFWSCHGVLYSSIENSSASCMKR